jgi:hypothetical protein
VLSLELLKISYAWALQSQNIRYCLSCSVSVVWTPRQGFKDREFGNFHGRITHATQVLVKVHVSLELLALVLQVKSGIFGKDLEKVSEYGAQEYPGVSPVCLLFSGCHYDLLKQVLQR